MTENRSAICLSTADDHVEIIDTAGRLIELSWDDALWIARSIHLSASAKGLI